MKNIGNFATDYLTTFIRKNNMLVNPIMKYDENDQEFQRIDEHSFVGVIDDANVIHLEYIENNKLHINSKILSDKIFKLLDEKLKQNFDKLNITIYEENNRTCMDIEKKIKER